MSLLRDLISAFIAREGGFIDGATLVQGLLLAKKRRESYYKLLNM